MKLLFDQNLSYALVSSLADVFSCEHVRDHQLQQSSDSEIWDFAAQKDLTIVTKDVDFQQRALLLGPPPKVVWLRIGNCPTDAVEALLRARAGDIAVFRQEPEASFLALS